jgi:hypothetical protein
MKVCAASPAAQTQADSHRTHDQAAATMTAALLAKDVHVCVADNNAIFLDLRHDRYIGLDAQQTDVLRAILRDEPRAGAQVDALVAHLIEQNLFTHDSRSGRALRLTEAASATEGLIGFEYDPPCRTRWRHVIALAAAYFEVAASLRLRSLAATISTASKRRRSAAAKRREPVDMQHVRMLVLAFRRLRPLFYKARESCLLDSLVLTSFLAKYGVFPNVIIGVTLGPFGGHCWVQYETVVLNDRLERVAKFTPIMSS